MTEKSVEEHAENWDLRHEDFKDNDFLYDVYSVMLVNYAAANRDARQFPDPDRCILDRNANRHLGFGAGVHRCLGSNLARLEFTVGIEQVLSRLPDYTLAAGADASFHGNSVTRGYRQIPVTFTPGDRSTCRCL